METNRKFYRFVVIVVEKIHDVQRLNENYSQSVKRKLFSKWNLYIREKI